MPRLPAARSGGAPQATRSGSTADRNGSTGDRRIGYARNTATDPTQVEATQQEIAALEFPGQPHAKATICFD
jgi:hypothetical protein